MQKISKILLDEKILKIPHILFEGSPNGDPNTYP